MSSEVASGLKTSTCVGKIKSKFLVDDKRGIDREALSPSLDVDYITSKVSSALENMVL